MLRKLFYLTAVSFLIATVHSCSLNNGIITPPCKVFEADLTDRWWYPHGGKSEDGIYFSSNGSFMRRNSNDSMTYTLYNCNKIDIQNHTKPAVETMEIGKLVPDRMTINIGKGKQVTYLLTASK
jgi:hypothetical protein